MNIHKRQKSMFFMFLHASVALCLFYLVDDSTNININRIPNNQDSSIIFDPQYPLYQPTHQVNATNLNFRSTPDTQNQPLRKMKNNESLQVLRINGDWAEVVTSHGEVGFLHKKYLKPYGTSEGKTEADNCTECASASSQDTRPLQKIPEEAIASHRTQNQWSAKENKYSSILSSESSCRIGNRGFGRQMHPRLKYVRMHSGHDIQAPGGTRLRTPANGVVIRNEWAGDYGRRIEIRLDTGITVSFSHMKRFAADIKVGSKVTQGQVVGYVGTSGLSTGNHLHLEVIVNDKKVNPKNHFTNNDMCGKSAKERKK